MGSRGSLADDTTAFRRRMFFLQKMCMIFLGEALFVPEYLSHFLIREDHGKSEEGTIDGNRQDKVVNGHPGVLEHAAKSIW